MRLTAAVLATASVLACGPLGFDGTLVVGTDQHDAGSNGGSKGTASLAEGLVAYWKLDDGAGARHALDSSGHGNHAIPQSVSRIDWTTGHLGGALAFGDAGWLQGTEVDSLDAIGATGLSIALWIRISSLEDREQMVLQRQEGTGAGAVYALSLRRGRPALAGMTIGRCESQPLPTGRWVHLAATYDGRTQRLFVDGVEAMTCETSGIFAPGRNFVTVGAAQVAPSPFSVDRKLRGILDEVMLYSRPLSSIELRALAAGQIAPAR